MIKYIFTFIIVLFSFFSICQDPVLIDTKTIDLETEFITAMHDVVLEDYDTALDKLKKLKRQINDDGIVYFEIAKIYLVKNNLTEAEFNIKKAIEIDDKLIYKQFLLDVLKEQEKYEEAATLMESLLDETNFERRQYYRTADLYQKGKQTNKALKVLEKLTKKIGYNKGTELYKVNIILRSRDYNKALKLVNSFLSKNKNDIKFLEKKALVFRLMNKSKDAVETYTLIKKLDSDNLQANSYLNAVNRFNKNEVDYIKGLNDVLENPKISLDDKIKLLIPYVEKVSKGDSFAKALSEAVNILLKQYPDNAKTNALYGDILYNSDELENSLKYYNNSLKYSKNNYEVWKQVMTLDVLLEKWDDLAKISEESIEYYPNQVIGYYNAGRAFINLSKVDKGLDYLNEALDYSKEKSNFRYEVLLMKSKGYIIDNKLKKASKELSKISDKFKLNHPFYWELKGDIEEKKGELTEAKKYWQKSKELGNNTKRLLDKLK